MTELSQDKNWRIKHSVVQLFPILAKQLGEAFFNDKLNPICITWLSDSIYSIREAALANIRQLTEIFGAQWAVTHVIPKLLSLHVDKNYLHRLTPLFGMATLAGVVQADVVRRMFLPVLVTLKGDIVPNIRMNVAKTIQTLLPFSKGTGDLDERLKNLVKDLGNNDSDQDVKYFAQRALQQ